MAGKQTHSDELIAQLVAAVLDDGRTAVDVAREHGVPEGTVREYAAAARRDDPERGAQHVDTLEDAVREQAWRMLAVVRHELDTLEEVGRVGDLHRAMQLTQLLKQISGLAGMRRPDARAKRGAKAETPAVHDFLGELAKQNGEGTATSS